MKSIAPPPRRRLIAPVAVTLGLAVAGCASDPYAQGVGLNDRESKVAEEQPNPTAARAMLRVATATRGAGDYASAINVLKRAHKLAPTDVEILVELGESLAAVRAFNEAREILNKAAILQPGNTRASRGLANALVALSEPALALTRYRQALAIKKEAATYNGLGVTLDILNDRAAAEDAYRAGLALEPHNLSLVGNAALSLALQGKHQAAIDLIAAELRVGHSNPRLRQNLALVYGLAGRHADARAVLRIDLDEGAVRNNISYYEMLRGLRPESRRETVLGRRSVVIGKDVAGALTVPASRTESKKSGKKAAATGPDTPARLPAQPRPDVEPASPEPAR